MAFDANYPVTDSTPWNTLYAGLRSQFTELNNLFSVDGSWKTASLTSNWSCYSGGSLYYKKDSFGRVYLRNTSPLGIIIAGSGVTNPVCTLDSGYRPSTTAIYYQGFSDYSAGSTGWGYFYIGTDGTLNCSATPASLDMIYLATLYFDTKG
jgi:hypothetical protein